MSGNPNCVPAGCALGNDRVPWRFIDDEIFWEPATRKPIRQRTWHRGRLPTRRRRRSRCPSSGTHVRTGWLAWSDSNCGIHLDRNPFELPRKSCPIWLKALFRDGSSMSCGFASLQLRQQTVSTGGNTRAGQRTSRTGRENNYSRRKFPLDFRFQQSNALSNGHRALPARSSPPPARARGFKRPGFLIRGSAQICSASSRHLSNAAAAPICSTGTECAIFACVWFRA